ncbi:hypothetical protein BH23GEM10_BH23GEM10_01210 [soil metagenome]
MRHLIVAAMVVLTACASRGDSDDPEVNSPSDLIGDWSGSLQAVGNSGVGGSVNVVSAVAGSRASVSITGAAAGAHHPWHVHQGTCGSGGAIVGGAGSYPALHVSTDGTASASATISVALHDEAAYHVNVHRSPTELGTIIACARIRN